MSTPMVVLGKRNMVLVAVVAAITIALIVANMALGYRNTMLRQSIGALRSRIQGQEVQLLAEKASDPQATEIEDFLTDWERRQIDFKSISEFTTQLAHEATSAGLQVVRITPDKWSTTGWLSSCPFNLEFRGTFQQLLRFLRHWDYVGKAVVIHGVDIERAAETGNSLQIRIKFIVYGEKLG